jgi:hypothetical protein
MMVGLIISAGVCALGWTIFAWIRLRHHRMRQVQLAPVFVLSQIGTILYCSSYSYTNAPDGLVKLLEMALLGLSAAAVLALALNAVFAERSMFRRLPVR